MQSNITPVFTAALHYNSNAPPARKNNPTTPQKLLRNGLRNRAKSQRQSPGFQTPRSQFDKDALEDNKSAALEDNKSAVLHRETKAELP